MVCYNSERTIERALSSIQRQKVLPDELIIIDGGSTDKTLKIVKSFGDMVNVIVSERDNGIYNAMNKGLKLASGDIVGFLNSDDEFSGDDAMHKINEAFRINKKTKIFVSGVDYLDANGSLSRRWRLEKVKPFVSGWHPPHPGFYASRTLLMDLNGFNEAYRIASDFDLMLRSFIATEINDIYVDDGKIVNMFLGGASNASLRNIFQGNAEIRRSLTDNGIKVTIMYTLKRLTKKLINKWL